jgi:hypothetical protein
MMAKSLVYRRQRGIVGGVLGVVQYILEIHFVLLSTISLTAADAQLAPGKKHTPPYFSNKWRSTET